MTRAAVVTAAGYGTRLGVDLPKALVPIAGEPLIVHALRRIGQLADRVVVTAPPTHLSQIAHAIAAVAPAAFVVAGADTRQGSVRAGLAAAKCDSDDIILVHDAARAFMPVAAMADAVAAVEGGAAGAVPVIPVVDTIVNAPHGEYGAVVARDDLRIVQTPQVFRVGPLVDAHTRATADGIDATDDAALLVRYGYRVVTTLGHPWGLKVTLAGDLALAAHLAEAS